MVRACPALRQPPHSPLRRRGRRRNEHAMSAAFSAETFPNRFDHASAQKRIYQRWEEDGYFHAEPELASPALRDRHSASQRHRRAASGACPQQHTAGHPDSHEADAGLQYALDAGHRSCGYRHAGGGGETSEGGRREDAARSGPRRAGRTHLGLEGCLRNADYRAAQVDGLQLRLAASPFHARRHLRSRRPPNLLRPVSQAVDLPRQAAGQLGSRFCRRRSATTRCFTNRCRATSGISAIR